MRRSRLRSERGPSQARAKLQEQLQEAEAKPKVDVDQGVVDSLRQENEKLRGQVAELQVTAGRACAALCVSDDLCRSNGIASAARRDEHRRL